MKENAMPIHDWTRVDPGIFHHFHHTWITEIQRALNRGLLPPEYYALAEQIAGGLGPDVIALQGPAPTNGSAFPREPSGGIALAESPPRVAFRRRSEMDQYAAKAKAVVIRHKSGHDVIAVVEIVSPGNKNSRHGLRALVDKAVELLRAGVHLLVIDLFPPSVRDPQGIHKAIWDEIEDQPFELPADKLLTLAAYSGGPCPEMFVQPVAVGQTLPDMPLFLTPDVYINVPLEATYQAAWADVPSFWQDVLTAGSSQQRR
jgi:hypothetical protein